MWFDVRMRQYLNNNNNGGLQTLKSGVVAFGARLQSKERIFFRKINDFREINDYFNRP